MTTDTIVRVDPKTLLVGPNVRKDAALTREFVASIKELGVRIPVVAYETDEGLVVVDGQRRTLAAVDAGVAEIPVVVVAAPSDTERLVDQVVVNEHRAEITEADAVEAVQQLALFEMKVPAIAKKLGIDKRLVESAVTVGTSAAAKEAFASGKYRLDTAVVIAEFEGQPEQAELLGLSQGWQVDQRARELREQRDRDSVVAEIEAMPGVALVKEPDFYSVDTQPLAYLFKDEALTMSLEDLPHEEVVELAGDGLVAWPSRAWGGARAYEVSYGIRGWRERPGIFTHQHIVERTLAKPATPEDAEKLKAARRKDRENTKLWIEATGVRIAWLQALLQRKAPPKGWESLVAARMLNDAGSFSTSQLKMMLALLQVEQGEGVHSLRNAIEKYLEKVPTRAPLIMLAVELGCVEGMADFDKKGWAGGFWQVDVKSTIAYLKRLAEWGYPLTDFERLVVAGKVKKAS